MPKGINRFWEKKSPAKTPASKEIAAVEGSPAPLKPFRIFIFLSTFLNFISDREATNLFDAFLFHEKSFELLYRFVSGRAEDIVIKKERRVNPSI